MKARTTSSVVERFVHIEEAVGPIPTSSTMNNNLKKIIFFIIWTFFISLGPITVIKSTNWAVVAGNHSLLINIFQRIFGLLAFTMLFSQVVLGSFMTKLTDKLGGWIYTFHV